MRLSQPRVEPLSPEQMDPETRAFLEKLAAGGLGGGRVLNIFRTLAHHPELMRRWLVFGNHVLGKSKFPPRERELAILRVGFLCKSEYEWGQHVLIAQRCGITDAEIARIAVGPDAAGWSPADAAVLRAADELHGDQMIGAATWTELSKTWNRQQLMDLVFTIGQYHLVAMALNTFGVQRDPGVPGLP
jgi:4-carboxymuconolactone decarboxylase